MAERGRELPSKVMAAALRFLKVRPRSRFEVQNKLERGGFSAGEIEKTIQVLEEKKLVDDARFARWWAEDRALAGKYGPLRVRAELEEKGIAQSMMDGVLAEIYTGDRQREILKGLAAKGREEDLSKLAAKLQRAGFDEEAVEGALLLRQEQAS